MYLSVGVSLQVSDFTINRIPSFIGIQRLLQYLGGHIALAVWAGLRFMSTAPFFLRLLNTYSVLVLCLLSLLGKSRGAAVALTVMPQLLISHSC